ncbi:aminotransferase class V-fold PLP-dependent enzyme [Nonomuraea ceibae]|uniref:aminotransferase class V-fold PLP-dependent enzyme n=1 Tax=Nonomuraea ceibae TaxID=1935170 RepID=UPI001C5E1AB7|nr:aminotransferase class V-fold PLP-dependent enzyme [Nonomuraea ceibae]
MLSSEQFRSRFPALQRHVWLDTPASPPAALEVAHALQAALDSWLYGDFDWQEWDRASGAARSSVARLLGVAEERVAVVGSVAEAAATVAKSLPPGRIVVPAQEFRSNLFPWRQLESAGHEVTLVPPRDGRTRTEDLVAALDPRTTLLAVSDVLSIDGHRADLPALRRAADGVGARLFVDATQSLGALRLDLDRVRPDYLAVHGYKWMLCPRGAAWLVTAPEHVGGLVPLLPSWKSTEPPHGYFGGPYVTAGSAARCDTSPAWLSWVGALPALDLLLALDAERVERHCLRLAAEFRERVAETEAGAPLPGSGSHIAVVRVSDPDAVRARLAREGVRATLLGDRLRVGFHYFNDGGDVERAVDALRDRKRRAS